jgi:type II secretory pathway component HofQ
MCTRAGVLGACLALGAIAPLVAQQPQRAAQMPMLPLTQLDERALAADLDNRTFTLTFAQPVPIKDLLLLLVRGTSLSVVPDPAISGSFIGELKNVTVRQALGLILPPLGLSYAVDGPFIRVLRREPETRLFDINYIATRRTGASRIGGDAGAQTGSFATVSSVMAGDVFGELTRGVQTLLSEHATFNVDRQAGLVQVTDFPERLDRVAVYLEAVQDRVHRQVHIDARVIEVELNDEKARSLDWTALSQAMAVPGTGAATTGARPALTTGLRFRDVTRFLDALAAQGTVSVIASPQLLAINNEPAIVRAASPSAANAKDDQADVSGLDSLTLSVTPQIAPGGIVMLSLSPILTLRTPAERGKAAVATRESDTLARVADGETIVMSGFGRMRETREKKVAGVKGGWFGRSTVVTRRHVELLILLTPRILTMASTQ